MIKPLERKRVISLTKEIPTTGHTPLQVKADDNKTYFIKNYKRQLPAYYLSSEILCHYFLSIWEVPTPEIALLEVDAEALGEELAKFSSNHKPFYYDIPSFGSLLILGSIMELNSLTEPKLAIYDNIDNPEDLWKIALFDIWVDNDDRKPTNPNLLIRQTNSGYQKIYALDHAFCFTSQKYIHLNPDFGISQGFNENILYTHLANQLFKQYQGSTSFEQNVRDFFKVKTEECEKYFTDIWENIPKEFELQKEDEINMQHFLFGENRKQEVLNTFFEHINDY